MTKKDLAILIDSYADAKASGNKYLIQSMIEQLQQALDEVCEPGISTISDGDGEEQSLEY